MLTLIILVDIDIVTRFDDFSYMTYAAIKLMVYSPPTMIVVVATLIGFVFFTDTHSTAYRIIMGGLHALAHISAAFLSAIVAVLFVNYISPTGSPLHIPWFGGFGFEPDLRVPLAILIVLALGFVVGSFIMGAYLLLSFNFFGRHGNEAFSSIGVEDFKNSVRLHINERGDLTIYPIGLRRVPRKWKPRTGTTGPEMVPDDNRATEPELIEPPIVMCAAKTDTGVQTTSPDAKIEASTQTSTPTEG
jgi:hypothetical protein